MTELVSKETIKRYLISTGISFLTGFFVYLAAAFQNITGPEQFNFALIIGAVFAGVRLAVKSAAEVLMNVTGDKK